MESSPARIATDEEENGSDEDDVLTSRLLQTQGSDDWRLLAMDLEDALMSLEEHVKGGDAQPTPSKGKREMPSCVREVCSLVDSLVRQHAKCSEEGAELEFVQLSYSLPCSFVGTIVALTQTLSKFKGTSLDRCSSCQASLGWRLCR